MCVTLLQDLAQPLQLNGLQTTQLLHQADGDVERAFCSEVDAIYVDDQRLQEMALAYAAYRWATKKRRRWHMLPTGGSQAANIDMLAARGSAGGAVGEEEFEGLQQSQQTELLCCNVRSRWTISRV